MWTKTPLVLVATRRATTTFCTRFPVAGVSSVQHEHQKLKQRHQQRQFSSSHRRIDHYDDDPFEVLGVKIDTEEKEIKAQFYAKVKQYHPDSHQAKKDKASRAEFHRLCRAYEVLSDPALKAEYLLRHRSKAHKLRSRGRRTDDDDEDVFVNGHRMKKHRHNPVHEFNASLRRGRRATRAGYDDDNTSGRRRGATTALDGDEDDDDDDDEEEAARRGRTFFEDALALKDQGLLGQLQRDFDDAVLHAYLGPRVEEGTIPWAFECEERRPPPPPATSSTSQQQQQQQQDADISTTILHPHILHPHILQMTSGQQLLGYVEAAAEETTMMALPVVIHDKDLGQKDKKGGMAGEDSEAEMTLRSLLSGLVTVDDKANYVPLTVTWQDKPLAELLRLRDPVKKEDVIVVNLLQPHSSSSSSSSPSPSPSSSSSSLFFIRGLDTPKWLSSHAVYNGEGEVTHALICHRSPLVRHMHFLQLDGKVECRISRGWMPVPSEYWQFAPRSQDHDVGGWYVEQAEYRHNKNKNSAMLNDQYLWKKEEKEKKKRRRPSLHAAVYIAACSYRTLDKEEEQRQRLQEPRMVERVGNLAKGFMQKFM